MEWMLWVLAYLVSGIGGWLLTRKMEGVIRKEYGTNYIPIPIFIALIFTFVPLLNTAWFIGQICNWVSHRFKGIDFYNLQ